MEELEKRMEELERKAKEKYSHETLEDAIMIYVCNIVHDEMRFLYKYYIATLEYAEECKRRMIIPLVLSIISFITGGAALIMTLLPR